ncbi:hypothetical protein D7V93_01965 [Corallococcus llansteffanensis]|uniref:Carboxypeptidase regulatory-like domain-containing protein n=2 Tax=Corallococcus llansteffanensis TaxID=2316731 RepID=A0A3A8QGY2_9BACT|nr:hypothetical protein D7V93_01965 [Corallococcus llansteffanensis]
MLQGRFLTGDGKPLPELDFVLLDAPNENPEPGNVGSLPVGTLEISKEGYFRSNIPRRYAAYYLGVMGGKYHPVEVLFSKDTCVEVYLVPYKH